MLGMAGVRLDPGVRLALGAALVVVGLVAHVTGLIVAGALLAGWSLVSVAGRLGSRRDG
jgi:hypothetical protein